MENSFSYEHHHWGANKKIMDNINERRKSPETLRLVERRQVITKWSSLWFKFDSIFRPNLWVPRPRDKRKRDEVAATDLELLSRNNEKNKWRGSFIEFNEPKASSTRDQTNELENVSNTEESDVVKPPAKFSILDLKDNDIAERTAYYFQLNHVIEKPIAKSTEAEEILSRAEFDFMIDLKF